jgi:plasmid stabilization system protein ParE
LTIDVKVDPEAAAELEAAASWYEERRLGLGSEFLDAVDSALDRVSRWPRAGSPVPGVKSELDIRRAPIGRFPYHIVYLAMPDELRIIAFSHDRRRPGYWKARSD